LGGGYCDMLISAVNIIFLIQYVNAKIEHPSSPPPYLYILIRQCHAPDLRDVVVHAGPRDGGLWGCVCNRPVVRLLG
jgi:hypothetical protein